MAFSSIYYIIIDFINAINDKIANIAYMES